MNVSKEDLLEEIRGAAKKVRTPHLTHKKFRELTGIPISKVHSYFDSWTAACIAADVQPGANSPENLTPNYSKGKEHALEQLKYVAQILDTNVVSKSDFDAHATEIRAATVQKLFKGWKNALEAADLQRHSNYRDPISLEELAIDYLSAVREIQAIPTVVQMTRRSERGKNTFTRKFGTYSEFKRQASEYLLSNAELSPDERKLLEIDLGAISRPHSENEFDSEDVPKPGYVYLFRSGKAHKIGLSKDLNRRERELKIQLPEKAIRIHVIKTDDMRGIERYWHNRFKHKRLNGEFFDLSSSDVAAFKRRKFM